MSNLIWLKYIAMVLSYTQLIQKKYQFWSYNALSNKYFLDVFGITSVATIDRLLRALYCLGFSILYANFREVNSESGIPSPVGVHTSTRTALYSYLPTNL